MQIYPHSHILHYFRDHGRDYQEASFVGSLASPFLSKTATLLALGCLLLFLFMNMEIEILVLHLISRSIILTQSQNLEKKTLITSISKFSALLLTSLSCFKLYAKCMDTCCRLSWSSEGSTNYASRAQKQEIELQPLANLYPRPPD